MLELFPVLTELKQRVFYSILQNKRFFLSKSSDFYLHILQKGGICGA